MKPLLTILFLFTLLALSEQAVYACSCRDLKGAVVVDSRLLPSAEEIKKWREEQTDLAIFVGRVTGIGEVKMKESANPDYYSSLKKVTVRVERYWLGVRSREMIIYTGLGNGDCGSAYDKGKYYFFFASRGRGSRLLETGACSPKFDEKLVKMLDQTFGASNQINAGP